MTLNYKKVLVNGYSDVLLYILSNASRQGIPLTLYILESRPSCNGHLMFEQLKKLGFDCKIVVDCSVGCALEMVDYVISGAAAVTENGGIINKIGTYTLSMCANVLKKPVYVFTENFKFFRTFAISQKDIPAEANLSNEFGVCTNNLGVTLKLKDEEVFSPSCDFTPNNLITYIVSDSRIFKTSCVSDEFLQLFNL